MKNNMNEFFKKIDLMITLFIIDGLASLSGVVIGFVNSNQSAILWAISSTIWCAAAAAWYICYKK